MELLPLSIHGYLDEKYFSWKIFKLKEKKKKRKNELGGVVVIVVGSGLGYLSSNPECFLYAFHIALTPLGNI